MNKELTWTAKFCFHCREQFTPKDCQTKNYRLQTWTYKTEGILIMPFHKPCFIEFHQSCQKAWDQIRSDPIYQWA